MTDKQKNDKKTDKLGLLAPQGVDPPPQIFRVCRGGCTLHISSKHYMDPTPVYGARAQKPLQNADFAMKQTNICRLGGDIIKVSAPLRWLTVCKQTRTPLSFISVFRATIGNVNKKLSYCLETARRESLSKIAEIRCIVYHYASCLSVRPSVRPKRC